MNHFKSETAPLAEYSSTLWGQVEAQGRQEGQDLSLFVKSWMEPKPIELIKEK